MRNSGKDLQHDIIEHGIEVLNLTVLSHVLTTSVFKVDCKGVGTIDYFLALVSAMCRL